MFKHASGSRCFKVLWISTVSKVFGFYNSNMFEILEFEQKVLFEEKNKACEKLIGWKK